MLHTPVYRLLREMPYEEFVKWNIYFKRRPYGWREDLRAYYICRAMGLKEKPEDVFPSLKKPSRDDYPIDATKYRWTKEKLKSSSLYHFMLNSTGNGESISKIMGE